jgi:hypothetical protein
MLTIRQEQVEALRQYHLKKFEDEMVVHLAKFAPRHWQGIGEPTGRQVIRLGMAHAKKYGFTNRGPVRFYLELMFLFGSHFDTDPQHPWVREVLNDPEPIDQMARADRLFDAMTHYRVLVAGAKHRYFLEALQRLSEIGMEGAVTHGVPLEEGASISLWRIYPQACDYLGQTKLRGVIQSGFDTARAYGFASDRGRLLILGFTVFLGHRFYRDPLCGWITRRLESKDFRHEEQRVEELFAKSVLYINNVLGKGRG